MKVFWLGLPMAILVGCGGGGSTPNSQAPSTPPDPNAPRTITGTMKVDSFLESGSTQRITDLSGYTIKALLPNAAGGYTAYPGTGLADGSFSIPSVPPGECLIQLSKAGSNYTSHYWTNQSQIHLGGYSQGRSDWTPAPSGTVLDINPMVAPPSGTYGEIIAPSLGMQRQSYFSSSLHAWSFNLAGAPLPEAGKDAGYFSYLTPGIAMNSEGIQTIAGTLSLPSAGLQPGANTQLVVAPETVGSNATQAFTLDADAFTSAASGVGTVNEPRELQFTLKAQPFGSQVAPMVGATLLIYQNPASTGLVQQTGLPYANPYPASWGAVATARRGFMKTYSAPGASSYVRFLFSISVAYPKTSLPSQPIAPLVGPVRNLKVNGQALVAPNQSVGTTPLFTWDPPALGAPTTYELQIIQLFTPPGSTGTSISTTAFFRTTQTRIQIPPGILSSGATYFAILTSSSQGSYDPAHPNRLGFPSAFANHNTEPFMP